MKKIVILIMLILMSTCIFFMYGCEDKGYTKITATQGMEMIEKGGVIVVDVREQSEYNEGHIDTAILLPLGNIEKDAPNLLEKEATIIVYCRSGRRSAYAAKKFVSLGYKNIYDMGGIIDWVNQGYEVVN